MAPRRKRATLTHMADEVSVRELRQNLSVHLRLVAEGRTLTVTSRGEPVALLAPFTGADPLARLVAEGKVELPRAPGPLPEPLAAACGGALDGVAGVEALLDRLVLVRLEATVLDAAGRMKPLALRSLDAIHVQSALVLGEQLEALVTYDARMADAARGARLRALAPG